MIILKILLYILLAVLGLALAVVVLALALPITAEVRFIDNELKYKIKFSFLSLIDSDGRGFLKWLDKRKKNKQNKKKPEKIPDDTDETDDDFDIEELSIESNIDDIDIEGIVPDDEPEDDDAKVRNEKIRKIKQKKHHARTGKKPEKPDKDDDEKESLGDKVERLIEIWDSADRPLLALFRGFHFRKVYIDFIVANEDAYKCALNYGKICCIVYNLLAWLGELFTVSYKTVDIRAGFSLKKSRWDASFRVDFRLYTLAFTAVWFLIQYKSQKSKKRKSRKRGKNYGKK